LCTRKISRRCVLGGGEHIYVEQHGQGRIYLWYSSSTFKFKIHRLAISFLNHVTGNSQECTSGLRDNHLTPLKAYHRCQYGPLLLLYLLITQSFAGFVKNKLPGKLFFFPVIKQFLCIVRTCFVHRGVAISLIGRTAVGSLSVFEWAETCHAISY